MRSNWSVDQVYYHDPNGRLRTMPIRWTSLIAIDPAVEFGRGQSPFKLADLLELARLIDGLKEQQEFHRAEGSHVREGQDV